MDNIEYLMTKSTNKGILRLIQPPKNRAMCLKAIGHVVFYLAMQFWTIWRGKGARNRHMYHEIGGGLVS